MRRLKSPGTYLDGRPDPSPDYFTVERRVDGFTVQHFPNAGAKTPCCVFQIGRFGTNDVETLARAYRHTTERHATELQREIA